MMTYSRPTRKNHIYRVFNSPRKNSEITSDRPKLDSYTQQLIERGKISTVTCQKYLSNKAKTLGKSKSQELEAVPAFQTHYDPEVVFQFKSQFKGSCLSRRSQNSEENSSCEGLKVTTSTVASSPTLLKALEQIKLMSNKSFSQNSISSTNSSKSKLSIEDFQVIKYIQKGQFGAVYLARHKLTNFICALKKIKKSLFADDMRYVTQLIRQIKIQSFLDHPNIAQFYSFFDDQENLYLMLEYCFGGNLYTHLQKEKQFSEDKVRGIARQVSHAIDFMHDNDIIHRDIKPENILLQEGVIKICDFGWSIYSPLLRSTRCGTPLYSSPEIILEKDYDNKVDIWNIGILVYELLYGKVPFDIRGENDLLKIVDEDICFPKSIPVSCECKDFILKCLNKDSRQRWSMAQLIDHPFLQE